MQARHMRWAKITIGTVVGLWVYLGTSTASGAGFGGSGTLLNVPDPVAVLWNGTEDNDIYHATDGNDILNGHGGHDKLYGEDGDDYIYGGDGVDAIWGGDGNDTIDAGESDTLYGINGNPPWIDAGPGNDVIYVYGGSNWGSEGEDIIYFSVVEENASGGIGEADSFRWTVGSADSGDADRIADFEGGLDTLWFEEGFFDVDPGDTLSDLMIALPNNEYADPGTDIWFDTSTAGWVKGVHLANTDAAEIAARISNGTILNVKSVFQPPTNELTFGYPDPYRNGGGLHHIIRDASEATFDGSEENDVLFGTDGNDTIHGFGGDDFIYTDEGNDFLQGGAGSDMMSGGEGNDTFYWNGATDLGDGAKDVIADFELGVDALAFSANFFATAPGETLSDVMTALQTKEGTEISVHSAEAGWVVIATLKGLNVNDVQQRINNGTILPESETMDHADELTF